MSTKSKPGKKGRIRMTTRALILGSIPIALLLLAGCGKKQQQPGEQSALLGETKGSVAGVQWTVPKRWSEQGARQMRAATYTVPAAEGDPEPAECAVFYFGNSQGGSVDANIDRWVGQFETGVPPARSESEVNGMRVTLVQIAGTYLSPAGPMMQSQGKKENFRLLGAIAEGPQGSVFFKLTGPAKTVGECEKEFDAMVGSLGKQ
jgi:hypothetical protein